MNFIVFLFAIAPLWFAAFYPSALIDFQICFFVGQILVAFWLGCLCINDLFDWVEKLKKKSRFEAKRWRR